MTSSILGGIVTPPLPLVIIRHFLATPPHRARNSRQNWFRDKTPYVGFLTIVDGLSQPKSNIQGVFLVKTPAPPHCVTMPKAVRSFFHPFWGVRISLSIKLEGRLSGYRNWTCHHIEAIVTTLKFIVSGTAVPAPYFLEIHSGETMSYKIELSRTTTFYPISVDFLKITFSLVLV